MSHVHEKASAVIACAITSQAGNYLAVAFLQTLKRRMIGRLNPSRN